MHQSQIENIESWLKQYSGSFLSGNPKLDPNIQFKIDHTYRVRNNILAAASSLDLSPNDIRIAEVIGLLHDAGRFEQFQKYGTYRDEISVDHAEFGLKVIKENQVLIGLLEEEKTIVETAIRYHNKPKLAHTIADDCLVFCKLIRDADKLDILEEFVKAEFQYFPDSGSDEYSPECIESILEGRGVSYADAKTTSDIKLMRMSWVLDINYDFALKELMAKGFLNHIVARLPQTEDIQKAYSYLKNYMERRLKMHL